MLEILEKFNEFISELPNDETIVLADAKTLGTYKDAIKYVKSFKFSLEGAYHATAEEQIKSAFRNHIFQAMASSHFQCPLRFCKRIYCNRSIGSLVLLTPFGF